MNSRVKLRQKRKKRKWKRWVLGIFIGVILIIGGSFYYMWDRINNTLESVHNPLARDKDPERQKELETIFNDSEAVNLLLLGVDERSGDKGRSDTMILMSLNPKTDSLIMMSIPRDTYVNIPGKGMDKINHAYAFGGTELSVQTVEKTFDLPVHFYSKVNMEGFEQGIDAINGITVNNSKAFSQDGTSFSEGEIHLNGKEALKYIRMRKNDPRGDMGRNERQRNVITAAMNKAASITNITKFGDILHILGNNMETDLNKDRIQKLFTHYRNTRKNIKTLEIEGQGQMIGNVWYFVVAETEFERVSNEIKQHME